MNPAPIHRKRFAVYPGPVRSCNDGHIHHITADQLVRLYGVSPKHCVVITQDSIPRDRMEASTMFTLSPRYDGNYSLEDVMKRSIITYMPGDYPEDKNEENGNYWNHCSYCNEGFIGCKERDVCKVCLEEVAEFYANEPKNGHKALGLLFRTIWAILVILASCYIVKNVGKELWDDLANLFKFWLSLSQP
jgi:hypothetical protein